MKTKQQCSETWMSNWHEVRCSRNGKIERDGRWYCGQHDPEAVAAKHKARDEEWKAKWRAEDAKRAHVALCVSFHERLLACVRDAADLLSPDSQVAADIRALLAEIQKESM